MKHLPYHFTFQFFWSLVPFSLVLVSLNNAWLVFAEEKPKPSGVTLLLMKSGRMLSGHISEGAGGYLVKNPSGSLLVPYEDIVFEAKNLHEIYLKQRKSMKFPTANTHLNLARWCITNKLYEEAKIELKDAIRLEPKRSEPQLMLQRLMRDSSTNRLTVNQKIQEKILKKQAERSEEATSLTGISREQSAIFVRKIQPILSNKCGNANCHGSATKSQFRLTQISRRYGNHRIHAERNLAEVLRWIDLDDPTRSQLLVKPEKEHPQRGMVVFSGHAARKQKQLLQKWVSEVVADRIQQDELRAERLARRAARRHGQAKKNLLDPNWGKSAVKQAKLEVTPAALKGDISLISGFEPKKLTDTEIEEMVQPKPEDPFDPELFNNPKPVDQP